MDIPENAEGIENVGKDLSAELELRDTEEVPGREKFSTKGKLPVRDDLHVSGKTSIITWPIRILHITLYKSIS